MGDDRSIVCGEGDCPGAMKDGETEGEGRTKKDRAARRRQGWKRWKMDGGSQDDAEGGATASHGRPHSHWTNGSPECARFPQQLPSLQLSLDWIVPGFKEPRPDWVHPTCRS